LYENKVFKKNDYTSFLTVFYTQSSKLISTIGKEIDKNNLQNLFFKEK